MQVMDSSKNVRNNNESRHSWDALSKTIWMQNDERAHSIVSLLITNDEYHLELIFHSISMTLLNWNENFNHIDVCCGSDVDKSWIVNDKMCSRSYAGWSRTQVPATCNSTKWVHITSRNNALSNVATINDIPIEAAALLHAPGSMNVHTENTLLRS